MNREQEINEFLSYWAELYKSNPSKEFSYKHIYSSLIFSGVNKSDRVMNLRLNTSIKYPKLNINKSRLSYDCLDNSTFNNWIQMYTGSSKTNCFVQSNWQYFCQFISNDLRARSASEHIKIYIPLDGNHIEDGAKMIFDFLEQNNISHQSKIGSEIRFDDIVVRLVDIEDANKLIDFVSKNRYLQQGLIKANPFAFNKNGIAMAVDGSLSYNTTVSTLIKFYLDDRRAKNILDRVCAQDFYQYVSILYIDQFVNGDNKRLEAMFNMKPDEIDNYRQVIALILKVNNPEFNYDDYLDHYTASAGINNFSLKKIQEINSLTIEAMIAMTKRFNSNGFYQVEDYFYTGKANLITRTDNLRYRMLTSNYREVLSLVLKGKNMSFRTYGEKLLRDNNIDLNSYVNNMKI